MTTRNYATFDPAATAAQLELDQAGTVISTYSTNINATAHSLYKKQAGLWYVEFVPFGELISGGAMRVGLCEPASSTSQRVGYGANDVGYDSGGTVYKNNVSAATGATWDVGNVLGVLVDFTANTITFYLDGDPQATVGIADSTDYVLAASLSQNLPGVGETPQISMLLSAGQRQFEQSVAIGAVNPGWFDLTPGIGMYRIADRAWMTAPTDTPANVPYKDALSAGGLVLSDSLNFWPWRGSRDKTRTTLALHNADAAFDSLLQADARDADVTLRIGDTSEALDQAQAVARLVVDSVQVNDDSRMSVSLTDRAARLQRVLQKRLILPTADESAANKPWPWGVGAIRSAEAVNMVSADRLYALNDGVIAGMGAVRDRGSAFDPSAGDYTLDQANGQITLATEAQGKVTADYSTIGGSLPPLATDDLGGIGDPFASASWAFNQPSGNPSGWSIGGGELYYGQPGLATYGLTSTRTVSNFLTSGRVYKIDIDVERLTDRSWSARGQPPPNMAYVTIGSDNGSGKIDPASTFGRIYPTNMGGNIPQTVSVIGMAKRTGPLHIGLYTGAEGADLRVGSIVMYELDANDADDETLEPALLEVALRELLEVKGGLLPSDWSAADAAAIDAATGYAGIGYQAPSSATPTIEAAMREMLDSYLADYWIDETGMLRFVRLVDPANETSTATITADMLLSDPVVSIDDAPNLTTQLQGRKNWAPLAASEMVSDDLGLPYGLDGGDV